MVANKLMMNPDKTEFFIALSAAHCNRLEHLTFIFDDVETNIIVLLLSKTLELFLILI